MEVVNDSIVRLVLQVGFASWIIWFTIARARVMTPYTAISVRLEYSLMGVASFAAVMAGIKTRSGEGWIAVLALAAMACLLYSATPMWEFETVPRHLRRDTPVGGTWVFKGVLTLIVGLVCGGYEYLVPTPRNPIIIHAVETLTPTVRAGEPAVFLFKFTKERICPSENYGFWLTPDGTYANRFPMFTSGATEIGEHEVKLARPTDMLKPGEYFYRSVIVELCPENRYPLLTPPARVMVTE